MRTRSRSTPYTVPASQFARYNPSGGLINNYWATPEFTFNESNEVISDIASGAFGANHPCSHAKNKIIVGVTGGVRHENDPQFGGGHDELSSHHLLAMAGRYFGIGTLSPDMEANINWQQESAYAWEALKPGIKTEISSLNFIYEFREIKRLFDVWSKKRSRLKNLANAHLNASFGWAPLVSDTESILSLMVSFNQKWNKLVEEANKPIKRHYSRQLEARSTSSRTYSYSISCNSFKEVTVQEPLIYHATAQYLYQIPAELRGIPSRFLAMMDAYGLNLNPAIIWNAIPYSFAVDWISNVGNWLNSWTVKALQINIELTGFCHSVSRSASRVVTAYDYPPNGSLPECQVYREEASHYERRVTYPGVLRLPRLKTPRFGALVLANSLAIVKSKRPKAPRKGYLLVPSRIFVPSYTKGRRLPVK